MIVYSNILIIRYFCLMEQLYIVMEKFSFLKVISARTILGVMLFSIAGCIGNDNSADPELAAFLSEQDMHWTALESDSDSYSPSRNIWKSKANKKGYYSGALMGNGLLGTVLYRDASPDTYRLNVGRSDIIEQRGGSYDLLKVSRLPIGYFTLKTSGHVSDEKMDLSLYNAETTGTITTDRGSIDFATYVHALEDYIVFETRATGGEAGYEWDFMPFKAISPRSFFLPSLPDWYVTRDGRSNPDAYSLERDGIRMLVQPLARDTTFTDIAKYYVVAWKEACKGDKRRIIATVSFKDTEDEAVGTALRTIRKGMGTSSRALRDTHREWWNGFYSKVAHLKFPDPAIERFYWMQYYKFASTGRPGKPIVDLMGVWPVWDTPWPAVWMNLNVQLTYDFLAKANMGEFAQPLWDSLWENRGNLTRNVTDIPGQESWTDAAVLGRTCSYDLLAPLDPSTAESNCYEVGNLAWTLFYWYRQCRAYGDDEAMRDRLFPLLKASVAIFFHIRRTNPDGTYSLPETASPEYSFQGVGPNTNYDLANLRQALNELIEIDEKFSINDPMLPQWKDFLEKMPDFQYSDETGFKVSETTEFLHTDHRHFSHLFLIYPYHMLDWNDAEARAKAEFSIGRWHGDCGYSRTAKAAMLASEGLGDLALEQIELFMKDFMTPNTLYAEDGPCIETPLGAVSSLHELYLQDWGDRLRIFNGCPSAWKDASFERMRAVGAFLVDGERIDGRTAKVRILSEKGNPCRIQTDIGPSELKVSCNGRPVEYSLLQCPETAESGSLIEFPTTAGNITVIERLRP